MFKSFLLAYLRLNTRWLVLGFPALRSVPWQRPKGPSDPRGDEASEDDLLPILRGEPDTRLADIKQWLVNLDYAGKKELLTDFFELLQRFTPDLRIKLHAIDKKTMEISVDTDGGIVPLEAVSQGTGSACIVFLPPLNCSSRTVILSKSENR
jgi:hypothetical protein